MVRKSLNTHGTLSVYLLCRLLTVSCFQNNRIGEIVNSGSQSNSKVQSTLNDIISRFNELLSCLNKINNLFKRHTKSFKRVIILFKQDK